MDTGSHQDYTPLFRRLGDPAHTEAALREIYALFHTDLTRYITRFIPDDVEQVKDLVHEVLIEICEKPERLTDRENPKQWMLGIARNKIREYLRDKGRLPTEPLDGHVDLVSDLLADGDLEYGELRRLVLEIAEWLTPKEREVFMCRWEEELPNAEIAARLGKSRQTVKNQLSTAITKIGKELARRLDVP